MKSKAGDSGQPSGQPSQQNIEFEPQYECYAGVEHEWTGTLFVPTEAEMKKQEMTRAWNPEVSPVVGSKPILFVAEQPRGNRFARNRDDFKKVKMNGLDALKLRAKGQ